MAFVGSQTSRKYVDIFSQLWAVSIVPIFDGPPDPLRLSSLRPTIHDIQGLTVKSDRDIVVWATILWT